MNSTIAAQLMQMNDVCSNYDWFQYRCSGMLIGAFVQNCNTVWANCDDISNELLLETVRCDNVKVTYDIRDHQWYCEDVGQTRDGVEKGFTRIDDYNSETHTHSEKGTDYCIIFNQLFGGWSGGTWRYEGTISCEAYTGVTVEYLNNCQPSAE